MPEFKVYELGIAVAYVMIGSKKKRRWMGSVGRKVSIMKLKRSVSERVGVICGVSMTTLLIES